jgi:HEAT repeat protein
MLKKVTVFFHDRRQEIQQAACVALGRIGDPAAVPVLMETLGRSPFHTLKRTKDPWVRASAAWALGTLRDRRAEALLRENCNDRNFRVRSMCKLSLEKITAPPGEERDESQEPPEFLEREDAS